MAAAVGHWREHRRGQMSIEFAIAQPCGERENDLTSHAFLYQAVEDCEWFEFDEEQLDELEEEEEDEEDEEGDCLELGSRWRWWRAAAASSWLQQGQQFWHLVSVRASCWWRARPEFRLLPLLFPSLELQAAAFSQQPSLSSSVLVLVDEVHGLLAQSLVVVFVVAASTGVASLVPPLVVVVARTCCGCQSHSWSCFWLELEAASCC